MQQPPETIERAYRVRLRPTRAQERMLLRLMGARRYVWNWALARKTEAWRESGLSLNGVALSREFTTMRNVGETAWLAELPREPFNQTLRDFDKAWANFFAKRAARPRFRRRGTVSSLRYTLDQRRPMLVDRERGDVRLDGIGRVRFRLSEQLLGRLRSVTVSRDAAGRWFACFTADGVPARELTAAALPALGIDLGLKDTATLSDGRVVAATKHLACKLARLRRYQRKYSRQQKAAAERAGYDTSKPLPRGARIVASGRMGRTKRNIAVLHARVTDARRDHQHKLSHMVVRDAAVVAIEDLAVKAMAKGMGRRAFRRGVADAGLGEIRRQIQYKGAWCGRQVVAVGRFYPSSKTCSACGVVNAALRLQDRSWACACGAVHQRDLNAARNIEREGLRLLVGGPEETIPRRSRGNARGAASCTPGVVDDPGGQLAAMNRELACRAA